MLKISSKHKKIVIKVGSAVLSNNNGGIKKKVMLNIADDIAMLSKNKEVVLVSSGSIAMGKKILPKMYEMSLAESQAIAAIGQVDLMLAWKEVFKKFSLNVGQILLTPKEIETKKDRNNAIKTINQLHKFGVIPVINENDTTATDEIQFGDNDLLAANIAKILGADLLILLSSIDGLYDNFSDARSRKIIREVNKINASVKKLAAGSGILGKGGMKSKIQAAEIMLKIGSEMVIANGDAKNPILALKKSLSGTWFKKG
jgi:glutamate 5-kinase